MAAADVAGTPEVKKAIAHIAADAARLRRMQTLRSKTKKPQTTTGRAKRPSPPYCRKTKTAITADQTAPHPPMATPFEQTFAI
ncbi:hypothetical protein GCM10022221_19440 [Actinocorallia aurea]